MHLLSETKIPVLKELIDYEYPKEVLALEFEMFINCFTSGFPVRAFFMDKNNAEHFIFTEGKAEYLSPVDPGLLDIDCIYPYEIEEEYESKYFISR